MVLEGCIPRLLCGRDLPGLLVHDVEQGPVEGEHKLLAPHDAAVVGGHPHAGDGRGHGAHVSVGGVGEAGADLKMKLLVFRNVIFIESYPLV